MPATRYIATENYGAPGLYIRERTPSPPARGVTLNMIGLAGTAVRGPVGRVIEVANGRRFEQVFGGRDQGAGGAISSELWKAVQAKPFGRLAVVRVAAAAAVAASFTLESASGGGGTAIVRVDATSPGIWGNVVGVKVSAASDGNSNHWNLSVRYLGNIITYQNLDTSSTTDNMAIVIGTDDANLVVLTKLAAGRPVNNAASTDGADADGYVLLGQTVSGYTSVVGTEGSIADTDFTGTGKAMELLNGYAGLAAQLVVGRSNSTVKAKAYALAPSTRAAWLICPDSSSVGYSTFATEVASYRHERIWPVFNSPVIADPTTDELVTCEPHTWAASVISQTEEDVHLGDADNAVHMSGIRALTYESLLPTDIDAIDLAGVTVIEREIGPSGAVQFTFANGRTADLSANNQHIDGRRSKDFLIRGIGQRLRADVFKANTATRREATKSAITGFLAGLARKERFVDTDEDTRRPEFTVANDSTVNSRADRKAGKQRTEVRVSLIPHQLDVVLDIEVGTDVSITERAA